MHILHKTSGTQNNVTLMRMQQRNPSKPHSQCFPGALFPWEIIYRGSVAEPWSSLIFTFSGQAHPTGPSREGLHHSRPRPKASFFVGSSVRNSLQAIPVLLLEMWIQALQGLKYVKTNPDTCSSTRALRFSNWMQTC